MSTPWTSPLFRRFDPRESAVIRRIEEAEEQAAKALESDDAGATASALRRLVELGEISGDPELLSSSEFQEAKRLLESGAGVSPADRFAMAVPIRADVFDKFLRGNPPEGMAESSRRPRTLDVYGLGKKTPDKEKKTRTRRRAAARRS